MDSRVPLVDTMQEAASQFFPLYHQHQHQQQQPVLCDPISAKTSINKADSGLTYNMNIGASAGAPVSAPRKRPRDSFINSFDSYSPVPQKNKFSSVLDDDVFSQIHQQQQDIDRIIAQHVSFLEKNPTFC